MQIVFYVFEGRWALTCHVFEDSNSGMSALYNVQECFNFQSPQTKYTGRVRSYFIAAEEINWEYAPVKRNLADGKSLLDPSTYVFTAIKLPL